MLAEGFRINITKLILFSRLSLLSRFLRSIAYREFSQLVHGYLGNRRIPLPACAYHAIRKTFLSEQEALTGYVDETEIDESQNLADNEDSGQ